MPPPSVPLFAYGTLRDPGFQRELFGRTFPMERAVVRGFIVLSGGGGYFAARPQPDATIAGAIVALDERAREIADAWEDRAVYDCVAVDAVTADGRRVQCCMYVGVGARGTPVTGDAPAELSRAQVVADIRHFRAARSAAAGDD